MNDFWTYVELQLPLDSKVLVTPYNEAEYKSFEVGKVRYHIAVSGLSNVGFDMSREKYDRQQISEPTQMMKKMESLFQQAREPNTCNVLGCGRPATIDIVCVRWEMEGDFGSFSAGTPYRVCESSEHLAKIKVKHPNAHRYTVTPHSMRMSQ